MSNVFGCSQSEARSLLRLLVPLSDRGFEYEGRHYSVEKVIDALAVWADVASIEGLAEEGIESGRDRTGRDDAAWLKDRNTEHEFRRVDDRDQVERLLDSAYLTDREREVLDAEFGLSTGVPLSERETAPVVGMSRAGVGVVRRRALDKVRQAAAA